jgi:hypothetical protein
VIKRSCLKAREQMVENRCAGIFVNDLRLHNSFASRIYKVGVEF